jgi:hypothetical protein
MSIARFDLGSANAATQTAALAFAGSPGITGAPTATEEFTGAGAPTTVTITAS